MAVGSSTKLWLIAICWLLLIIVLTDWLERRRHTKNTFSKKQTEQYEIIK